MDTNKETKRNKVSKRFGPQTCGCCGREFNNSYGRELVGDARRLAWECPHCKYDNCNGTEFGWKARQLRATQRKRQEAAIQTKYPSVKVRLTGGTDDAYAILSRVKAALKRAGVDKEVRRQFMKEATSGDYDHLLTTCIKWVDVE